MANYDEFDEDQMSPAEMNQIEVPFERTQSNPNALSLARFLGNKNYAERKPKGEKTNVVDQHHCTNWQVEPRYMPELYDLCEKIRLDGEPYGLSVRQSENAKIWFDIDLKLNVSEHMSEDESLWREIAIKFSSAIAVDGAFKTDEEHSIYMLITNRTRITENNGEFKDGLHIYTSMVASQIYRKYITKRVATEEFAKTIFTSRKQLMKIKNIAGVIDGNSCNVLPLLLGATKQKGTPYKIAKLYRCEFVGSAYDSCQVVSTERINLTATFSVSDYVPQETQYMVKTLQILPSLDEELSATKQEYIPPEDDEEDDDINIVSQNDPTARELVDMIELLSRTRARDYSSWNTIMLALARYDGKYKSIAKKFSAKWENFDARRFEEDWAKAVARASSCSMITIGVINRMAREDNPAEYIKVINKSVFKVSMNYIFNVMKNQSPKTAALRHFNVADIIATAFPDKYIATPKVGAGGQKLADDTDVNYWVYSTRDSDVYADGNACKYIALPSTNMISVWISRAFPKVISSLRKFALLKKNNGAEQPDQADAREINWDLFLSILGKAHGSIHCHSFKTGVLREFAAISTKLNFIDKMDKDPNVMGIYDGLLEMSLRPTVIRGLSEHKVTKFAPSKYMAFDPNNPIILRSIQILLDFCPIEHFDVICYLLLFQSQVMTDKKKDLIMVNIWGHGRNGKSVVVEWLGNALGTFESNGYSYKFNTTVLTEKTVSSAAPRSDLMPMYKVRYLGSSESGRCPKILPENLKNVLSGERTTNRELYGTQKSGSINAVMLVGTNDPMEFNLISANKRRAYDIDYGSSRRFKLYKALMTYLDSPNKDSPFEKQNDASVFKELVHDKEYCGALLSILSIIYALLTMIHGGNMSAIVSPNIEKQTESHMDKQDVVSRFIKNSCVYSEEYEMTLNAMVDAFIDGYKDEAVIHDRDRIQSALILNPLVGKNIVQRDGKYFVQGIRCIASGEELRDGETMIEPKNKWNFEHFSEFVVPTGMKLPFDGKLTPTLNAADFARQLNNLYHDCLAEHDAKEQR